MSRIPLAVLAVVLAATVLAPAPSYAARERIRLGEVSVLLRDHTSQVVTVDHRRGHHARITLWRHRSTGGWERVLSARDARIGYGGLVAAQRRRQGTGTTPLGTFDLLSAFGTHRRDPDWRLRYRKIRPGDYWVQDNASDFYNRLRNRHRGGFRWWLPAADANSSERLRDYPTQYEWSIVTGFNRGQVRHRGSGIFLHVNGSGATAGCVSAPRWFIRSLMRRLDPERRPLIAIGR